MVLAMKRELKMQKVMSRGAMLADTQDLDFLEYWLSRPIVERLDEIERLRQIQHGADYATTHLLSRSDLRIQCRRG